jgi:hypothetical protein
MIDSCDGSSIEEGRFFSPSKKRGYGNNCCDKPINKNLFLTYQKFIKDVSSKQKFNKKNYHYLELALSSVPADDTDIKQFTESYFESNDERYVLYMINIEYKFVWQCEFLGIFDGILNKYVIVGCCTGHPFVITDEFIYNNSDGSGADIIPKNDNPEEIIKQLYKYYKNFCQDSYH